MNIFYLIGGGEILNKETLKIDKDIIENGGGSNSRVLFFPTAAYENDGYTKTFTRYYEELGAGELDSVKVSKETKENIIKKIKKATVLYFGGGVTRNLIEQFNKKGLAEYLKNNTDHLVFAGMSAGAIAFCGISLVSEIEEDIEYAKGFGLLDNVICLPHYEDKYKEKVREMSKQNPRQKILPIKEREAYVFQNDKLLKKIVS